MTESELLAKKAAVREMMAQDRQKLLMDFPFTGSVAMRLELVPVHDCRLDTCSTDFENIYADVEFYGRLDAAERLHVLAHEVWHCILLHGLRRQDRDHRRFNYAADLEIYFILRKDGLGIPFCLPHKRSWEGLSAEEIYERMDELDKTKAKKGDSDFKRGGTSRNLKPVEDGAGFDRHAEERTPADSAEGRAKVEAEEPYFDADYMPGWRRPAAESMREKVVAAALQVERSRGSVPAHVARTIEALLKPEVRWQDVLARFVTSCFGGSRRWLPPNRRYVGQGLYLQSRREERLRAVVALDTSGSTGGDLNRFFSELSGLLNSFGNYDLTVLQCDAEVKGVQTFDDANPLPVNAKWEVRGCGGTDFRPIFSYVDAHPELDPSCLIVFTDGYGPAPDRAPSCPVIWALTQDGRTPASWGDVLHVK